MTEVVVHSEMVLAAATELDLLADRLSGVAAVSGPATHVLPSGTEEVSVLAATHFNQVATLQDQALARGVLELRNAAMTLRAHAAQYVGQDLANAATIGTISV